MAEFLEKSMLLEYPLTALAIVGGIPVLGWIIEKINRIITVLLSRVFGYQVIMHILMYTTFPGVIHHELSHALVATITGAKVTRVALYKPEGNQLGYVNYVTRGPKILQSLQQTLSSMAPIICGCFSLYHIYRYIVINYEDTSWFIICGLVYLGVSIIAHMTMSDQDYRVMWKGMPTVYVLTFHAVVIMQISLFKMIMQ